MALRLNRSAWRRIVYVLLVLYMTGIVWWVHHDDVQRRHNDERVAAALIVQQTQRREDNCVRDRNLYDGEILIATFIGQKLGATQAEIAAGITDLKAELHKRPVC